MSSKRPALPFIKMQALGNDYVVLDARDVERADVNVAAIAPRLCDRRTGVGGDGVIVVGAGGKRADAAMRIINADGSAGERCGNGLRCVARLLFERSPGAAPAGRSLKRDFRIDVGDAIAEASVRIREQGAFESAAIDMGPPALALDALPADEAALRAGGALRAIESDDGSRLFLWRPRGLELEGALVSMGNPHLVLFADGGAEVGRDRTLLLALGPRLESHKAFPQRVNAHVARVTDPDTMTLHSWERGVGETTACGTGACAAVAAAIAMRLAAKRVRVRASGGELVVEQRAGSMTMTGPAERVFDGAFPLD